MNKKKITSSIILVIVLILIIAAVVVGIYFRTSSNIGGVTVSREVKETIENMTLEEKICQMIMPDIRTWSDTPEDENSYKNVEILNDELKSFLVEYNFGGICLFEENITGTEELTRLTNEIQSAASQSRTHIPMFLSIDQEGGYVTRLTTGTSGVGNMALAASGKSDNARIEADIIGKELLAVGVNINFGPVADVNNNPENPVIGVRSFSDDPQVISEYASSYIKGLHDNGIMSCLKHFPGHGDTNTDSHIGFPYIDKTLEDLNSLELVPFRELSKDTDIIMTAHIQFPQIETSKYTSISTGESVFLPATLSRTIITGILREDMGYEGVITTDALDMGAIADNFDRKDVAKYAINADVDILLMPVYIKTKDEINDMKKYVDEIVEMVKSGEISEAEIDNSVARILMLKEKYDLRSVFNKDVEAAVANSLKVVGSKEHHDMEWKLALDAVVEYKNTIGDIKNDESTKILYICPRDQQLNSFEIARQKLVSENILSESQPIVTYSYEGIKQNCADELENDIKDADIVIIVSATKSLKDLDYSNPENINADFCNSIVGIAEGADKQTILISSQLPYDANVYDVDAVYLAFNPSGATDIPKSYNGEVKKYGPNVPAAIYTALGGNKASGICPIVVTK